MTSPPEILPFGSGAKLFFFLLGDKSENFSFLSRYLLQSSSRAVKSSSQLFFCL